MGFWQRLFRWKKREHRPEQDDWEQIVYARDSVDFHDEEQRSRYITNCLEQIAEAAKESNLLTGEYSLVTAYLTDMEEIEALPSEEKEELERVARKLQVLEKEREDYKNRKQCLDDVEYYRVRKQEQEIEEGLKNLKENEAYAALVKQDMQRLNGERHAYAYRRHELEMMMNNMRGMAIIFLSALAACIVMLLILQFAFEMNTYVGYFLAVGAAAIAIVVLCIKYMDAEHELLRVENTINKLIQLQNKVKIRYVNNKNLLDYLYMKYNTDSAAKLEKLWNKYLQEKEERKQYAEAEAKTDYYQKELVRQLSKFRVRDPERWIHQVSAILDKREMVEIRHSLILRRQALRRQLDYNNDVAETARNEIRDVSAKYPNYAREILDMVDRYDRQIG